jgi:2-polyprenyl-3-methyl-5-hydroxy-6-metoxy-1,4-benzoquinol methylase
MSSELPASMAGIGTHEQAIGLFQPLLPRSAFIADLAAGQGAFTKLLRSAGHEVVAVDFNADDWKLPDVPLRVADLDSEFAETVLATNSKFDGIAAIEIIEHLENPFRFVRECAKLLKPGGLLLLTSPNVESVFSRLIFLYTGRLYAFNEYETVRPAHITPIFKWKLDMILEEAGFTIINEEFTPLVHLPSANLRVRSASVVARIVAPFLKGSKGEEGRIVVARLK